MNPNQLIRINEVSRFTSIAKSTINLWVAQGRFPRPIALSPTLKVWRVKQLLDWIDDQQGVTKEFVHSNSII